MHDPKGKIKLIFFSERDNNKDSGYLSTDDHTHDVVGFKVLGKQS